MAAVSRAIEPRWVLANTAGGGPTRPRSRPARPASFEEFLLRPLQANWSEVGDAANLVNSRLAAGGAPYLVIDSHPAGGSPTDARTQIATLAYYYLVADPDRTFLMFFGGSQPVLDVDAALVAGRGRGRRHADRRDARVRDRDRPAEPGADVQGVRPRLRERPGAVQAAVVHDRDRRGDDGNDADRDDAPTRRQLPAR